MNGHTVSRGADRGRRPVLGALRRRGLSALAATAVAIGTASAALGAAPAAAGPVGNGMKITAGDIDFVLKQVLIAERHSAAFGGDTDAAPANPHPAADPFYCLSLVGPASDQVPDALTSYGLRTVDGSCNNITDALQTTNALNKDPVPTFDNHPSFGAADQPFPRLTTPVFRDAENTSALPFPHLPPGGADVDTSYTQKLAGNIVVDTQPRLISNLIVDQTSTNPAAVAAAGHPQRSQSSAPTAVPCSTDPDPTADPVVVGVPAGCTPSHTSLFIPNITTDTGLSPPFNSLFTFFGQFFDHGVDQTVKSSGTVFVPLRADDPLIAGPDHVLGNTDDLPVNQRFMALTRAQNQPGPDGKIGTADDVQDANNTDSPWVDLSQDYASHSSHQVFLRDYALDANNHPVSTGKFLSHDDGGMPTWADVKAMAHDKLGLLLQDKDVLAVPTLLTDPYGNFVPGPARGLPQYVTATGTVEGDLANPVPVPADVKYFDTPFLTDVAHNADPSPQDTDGDGRPDTTPVPDADHVANHDFAAQPTGTYDDELLDSHAICGDGRCNENIALTTIHGIFHAEHNRLVGPIDAADQGALDTACAAEGPNPSVWCVLNAPGNEALLARFKAPHPIGPNNTDISYGDGGRLFQIARFFTEMQYQHLVFEEFARKVQPAVRPFHVYSPDINPATKAEFAHAVYRFGHSMLDDTIARSTPVGSDVTFQSTELLDGFLNPPALRTSTPCPAVCATDTDADHGMAAIIMGSSDQTGNEIDEFVVETLRNNLLGLPLDLPVLNMTRARSEGVPPLNQFRRDLFGQTNDGQLAPYASWSDFGQNLKHPESLVNFVAAYGTHPTITAEATIAGKRAAARAIVDPQPGDTPPGDAADFMFGLGGWANNPDGTTTTGLDSVDLWVGGLAEATQQNGGMLGSTFNYVFQTQLELLQDGDRLYYLNRTPGTNFRTQLEGNSFAELIQRNVPGTSTLKADAFARADCKFEIGNIQPYSGAPAASAADGVTPLTGADAVDDDPSSDCDENQVLKLDPATGVLSYRSTNKIDPPGINGQSVYNGTSGADKVTGGVDNDTFWGGPGNDRIEGGNGDDIALGGEGNDIITDLNGADVPKGGPGNDAIDGGPGDDIPMGNDGQDFINGGQNDNETFAGEGNDFVIAGGGADAVFGDGGDDWIQGGTGQDLLQGDHGAPFFDDPGELKPGNDLFVGQPGENDYDAEGGDDVMAQNAAVDRNAGSGGFDWAFHQYNTTAANDDMMINNNLGGLPIQVIVNRDRWQETEADSGGRFNDVIKGTDGVLGTPKFISGGGFSGCDAVDADGLARITGFDQVLPPNTPARWTTDASVVAGLSASGRCPLTGRVWGDGDVLLGGPGSDTFTGRTGDDVIDGDKFLQIAITVHANPDGTGAELGRTDLMENRATSGSFGSGTAGMTLQQAVFAGLVDPGQLVAVREIVTPTVATPDCGAAAPVNCDVAVFAGPSGQYVISEDPDMPGAFDVRDTTSVAAAPGAPGTGDGTDIVRNVEQLRFTDATISLVPTASLTPATLDFGSKAVGSSTTLTVTIKNTGATAPVHVSAAGITGVDTGSFNVVPPSCGASLPVTASCVVSVTFAPTTAGTKSATLSIGSDAVPALTVPLTGTAVAATPPAAPVIGPVTSLGLFQGSTVTVPFTEAASTPAVDTFVARLLSSDGTTTLQTITLGAGATSVQFSGVAPGDYQVVVTANSTGGSTDSQPATFSVRTAPGVAPTGVGVAINGVGGVTVSWNAGPGTSPANGNSPVTGYLVQQVNPTTGVATGPAIPVTGTSTTVTGLGNGTTVAFRVAAVNLFGPGPASAAVTGTTATAPAAPAAPTVTQGNGTLTVHWAPPANTGGLPITSYTVTTFAANGTTVQRTDTGLTGTSFTVPGLAANTTHQFRVRAVNGVGAGGQSGLSGVFRVITVPTAPRAPTTTSGVAGGAVTFTAAWNPPANTGGTGVPITGYTVTYFPVNAAGVQNGAATTFTVAGNVTTRVITNGAATPLTPNSRYRFTLTATNAVGTGVSSGTSTPVAGAIAR